MQNNFGNIDEKREGAMPPSIPFEAAWATLKPKLDKEAARRKRRKRVFIFCISILVIGLISGLVILNENKQHTLATVKSSKAGSVSTPAVSAVALPIIVGKSLFKKSKINTQTRNITSNSTEDNSTNTIQKGGVVASSTVPAGAKFNNSTNGNSTDLAYKHLTKPENPVADSYTATESKEDKAIDKKVESKSAATDTTTKHSADSLTSATAIVTSKTSPKSTKVGLFHIGLQLNVPVEASANSLDVNGKRQPLSLLVPQVFITKNLSKKQRLLLAFNPYSQYYLDNKHVISNNNYNVTIQHGANEDNLPQQVAYSEQVSINKLISMEATLMYQYQLSDRIKIGLGVSNNWLQSAVIANRVFKNNTIIAHDSIFGIDKSSREWDLLKSSFAVGKLEMGYQYKKMEIGAVVSKPISNISSNTFTNKAPLNTNLFIRFFLK